ncbi:hypothetical protein ASF98_21340 [Arthrobacter sp. Leaf337]|uniref:matrixin family metalloprotease n=1 Tax=Arthrobacter sp. Leaf337 TaxID=1736342 RepID=UPI00070067E4|nr:matrixin family metalloprotease [Arthrobacter sp. Leaf337]KQR77294.1 hypothetical protein ASF98_21340 [Arthrobacter sp. Leaf337]
MAKIQRNEPAASGGKGTLSVDKSLSRTQRSGVSGTAPEDRLPKVTIDGEEFWRVEGDYLLDVDQLFIYTQQQAALREAVRLGENAAGTAEVALSDSFVGVSSELVGILQGSKIVRWSPGTTLTYCVLRKTFNDQAQYEEIAANMQTATRAWEETCGIKFEYRNDLDGSDSLRPPVVFPVRLVDASGAFIAAAFFPNDIVNRRRLLIDPSYFTTGFDHVGVLRHELGHTLGFRHEHIRSLAPRVCPDEDSTDTIDLSAYDPKSVMHYFCGGVGSRDLAITDVDRAGSQKVYGPPFTSFELIDA